MKSTARLATAGAAALAATALLATPGLAATQHNQHPGGGRAGEVFVQTDATGGNAVVVYQRDGDGTLAQAGQYATGGLGGILNGSVVDHLASQGSLSYDAAHGLLYAVNAGSDTITVFGVHAGQLTRHQVIGSGGSFPASVAVRGNVVYVLNARGGGSVQGFLRVGGALVRVPSWHRALSLDASQTPEFTSTPGQVAFTPDGRHLVVTTKGNGNDIDVFAVGPAGAPAAAPVTTSYYAPTTTTSYYAPEQSTAVTSYYAPTTTTYYAPAPVTSYYAPAPVTSYYAPATTAYYAPATTAYYAPATTAYYAPTTAYYAPESAQTQEARRFFQQLAAGTATP